MPVITDRSMAGRGDIIYGMVARPYLPTEEHDYKNINAFFFKYYGGSQFYFTLGSRGELDTTEEGHVAIRGENLEELAVVVAYAAKIYREGDND